MSINSNRQVIRYNNITLFKSDSPAYNQLANEGASSLKYAPYVQSLEFSFNINRDNVSALGTKSHISQSNFISPDINLSVNSYEDFGVLFSGLFSANAVKNNLTEDCNFYAIISEGAEEDMGLRPFHGADSINFGNAFLDEVSISQGIGGILESQYSYTCSNVQGDKITGDSSTIQSFNLQAGNLPINGKYIQQGPFNDAIFYTQQVGVGISPYYIYKPSVGGFYEFNDFVGGESYRSYGSGDNAWEETYYKVSDGQPVDMQFFKFKFRENAVSCPAIDLSGSQEQNLSGVFARQIEDHYSVPETGRIIPSYSTSVQISGNEELGVFLASADTVESFDINLPIERKAIYGLGKRYPTTRKALSANMANFSMTHKVSDIQVSGEKSNLQEFMNSDDNYTINLFMENTKGDTYNFVINNAKLISQNYNQSIGRMMVANLGFQFDLYDIQQL